MIILEDVEDMRDVAPGAGVGEGGDGGGPWRGSLELLSAAVLAAGVPYHIAVRAAPLQG